MAGSESSWALGRSQAALNARALGLFSAQGADGKPIFYGGKVAFEEDRDVPFSVVGRAVAQAAPAAVIEQFNKVGLHPADTLMLANPERLVSIERHEALEGAGHWEFLRAHREERADGAWRAEIERLERESAAYEAQAMEGKEAARPLGAVDERARAEEAAAAQDMAGRLGFVPGAVLAKDGKRYRVEAVVNPEGGPCAVLSDENGERRDVRLRGLSDHGFEEVEDVRSPPRRVRGARGQRAEGQARGHREARGGGAGPRARTGGRRRPVRGRAAANSSKRWRGAARTTRSRSSTASWRTRQTRF